MEYNRSLIFRPTENLPVFDEKTCDVEMDPEQAFQTAIDHANHLVAEWAVRREEIGRKLIQIALQLDEIQHHCNISTTVGSSVGIAGGIVTVAGLILMPPVAIAGAIVGGVGAATNIVTSGVNMLAIKKRMNEVAPLIERDKILWDLIIKAWTEVARLEQLRRSMGPGGPKLTTMAAPMLALGTCGLAGIGARALITETGRLTPKLASTLGHLAAGLGIALDTLTLVQTARDLRNGSKSEYAAMLREFAEKIEEEKRSVVKMNALYQFDAPDPLFETY
ncbi:unnamed protein product, partial [Mesorhabditis belari]|uniref:Apolipoprotein L3 n=1 Tax=Mesorhabditis belari TaxID=2138241 RepID=A0AAF3F5H3_9BILA